jgi:hypothetical protein
MIVFSGGIENALAAAGRALGSIGGAAVKGIVIAFRWVEKLAGEVINLIKSLGEGILSFFKGLATKLSELFEEVASLMKGLVEGAEGLGEPALAGGGKGDAGGLLSQASKVEDIKVPAGTRKIPTTVGDLRPPKVAKVGETPKTMPKEELPEGYEDLYDRPDISKRKSPGGKQPSEKAETGKFAHKYYEELEDLLKNRAEEFIPPSELKPGLKKEFEIPHPDYEVKPRIDRLDWEGSEVIEIKPRSKYWENQGFAEAQQYAEWMNKYAKRTDGRLWKPRVVFYDLNQVRKFLKDIGYFPK